MGNHQRVLTLLALVVCASSHSVDFAGELRQRALRYFIDHTHARTGLVRDRADNQSLPGVKVHDPRFASIAATGFGLAVFANAALRGELPRSYAVQRVRAALKFTLETLPHYRGWLYHFVDRETGKRWPGSEISTVDTAWFLAGALYAAEALADDSLRKMADVLYRRVDFIDMMTDGGNLPAKRTLSMGWSPEEGYLEAQWDSYAEHLLLVVMGLGHPLRPLPKIAWTAWARPSIPVESGDALVGAELPLFAHQYSQLFVDFRGKIDGIYDYFHNSFLATRRDRQGCSLDTTQPTYIAGFWGRSASDSANGYQAFSPVFHDGTVCPACAGASAPFAPQLVLADLQRWRAGPHQDKLWGRYGFVDSFNLRERWFDPDVIGITVGALYLGLADAEGTHAIWKHFERIPAIKTGLRRAGLVASAFH